MSIPEESFRLIIQSIIWAMKHTERQCSQTGLEVLRMYIIFVLCIVSHLLCSGLVWEGRADSISWSLLQDVLCYNPP